jgi:hypothetical protein
MLKNYKNSQLLILLGIVNADDFLHQLDKTYPHNLSEVINSHRIQDNVFISAILNKGIFAGIIPVDIVGTLISLGAVASSILVPLTILTFFAMGLFAWYTITVSAKAKMEAEEALIKEKLALQLKKEILLILKQRMDQQLAFELNFWQKKIGFRDTGGPFFNHQIKDNLYTHFIIGSRHSAHYLLQKPFNTVPSPKKVEADSFIFTLLNSTSISIGLALVSVFLGSAEILAGLGFLALSSSLLTPVGIGVAAVVALGFGIYISYHRYVYQKHIAKLQNEVASLVHTNQQLLNDFHKNKALVGVLRNAKTQEHTVDYQHIADQFNPFSKSGKNRMARDAATTSHSHKITFSCSSRKPHYSGEQSTPQALYPSEDGEGLWMLRTSYSI